MLSAPLSLAAFESFEMAEMTIKTNAPPAPFEGPLDVLTQAEFDPLPRAVGDGRPPIHAPEDIKSLLVGNDNKSQADELVQKLDDAVAELGQVAEGIYTLKLVKQKAEAIGIYMPLVRGLYEILYDNASIKAVINSLMMSVQNSDVEFILPRTISQ